MKRIRRRVQTEDYSRVLLTETSTYDAPVIFSNLGFYWHWKKYSQGRSHINKVMTYLFANISADEYTVPFRFRIRKNLASDRILSLIHPRSQIAFIEFYQKFDQQMLLACTRSKFSIRHPKKIGSKYYVANDDENKEKFEVGVALPVDFESRSKYLTSYFTYSKFTRLHKFFDSSDFSSLERRYGVFWSTDVSRCFDSIYTHSVTWALKTKEFSKHHRNAQHVFGGVFDRLMQSANYNETAGIVIGPEISRIFAEIILQEVDENVRLKLVEEELIAETHYDIRRYVDDIHIFTHSERIAERIMKIYEHELSEFKLSINSLKTVKSSRPFISTQSRALVEVHRAVKSLMDRLLKEAPDDMPTVRYVPRKIRHKQKIITAFLREIKSACFGSNVTYEMVCGYLVSVLCNRIIRFSDSHSSIKMEKLEEETRYSKFFQVLLALALHFYSTAPSHAASLKIFLAINRSCTFFDKFMPAEGAAIRSLVSTSGIEFFKTAMQLRASRGSDGHATVESLNLLVAMKSLGYNFLLSRDMLISLFDEKKELSYFEIVTLLYYVGHDKDGSYKNLKEKVIKDAGKILENLSDIRSSSLKAHLLLDMLACPYVPSKIRNSLCTKLLKQIHQKEPTAIEASSLASKMQKFNWFVTWNDAEVMNTLEKKLLLNSY